VRPLIIKSVRRDEAHGDRKAHHQDEAREKHCADGQTGPEKQPDDRFELEQQVFHDPIFPARIKLNTRVRAAQAE
jgi:hypothetical protein